MTISLLFFAMLMTSIGQSIVIPLLPPLGREVGLSELQVATILSVSALVFAICTTLWGRASLRYGHKRIMMTGLAGYTIGTLVFGGVLYMGLQGLLLGIPLFAALVFCRALQSSIMSATPPSALGYSIAYSGESNHLTAVSRITSASSLGQILGPVLGGVLVVYGLLVPLFCVAALTFIALILVTLKLPQDSAHKNNEQKASPDSQSAPRIGWSNLRFVLIAAMLFCALGMTHQTLGFFFMDTLAMTPVQAVQHSGAASMIIAVVSLSLQFGLVQRSKPSYHPLMLSIGLILLISGYGVLTAFHSETGIYGAMVLLGAGMGLSYPTSASAATSTKDPRLTARITGLISAAPAAGFIVGPPLAALLYRQQASTPFAAAGLLIAVALFIQKRETQ